MTTIDAEPIHAVAVRNHSTAVGQALAADEILAQVKLIQDVMKKVMHEGEHFGTIPGCGDKKTLLQPGAQKLTMTFRLAPEYVIQESLLDRGHKEYRVICTLKSLMSGNFVGQGVGCCSSMESKYRWRGGARKCPKCGKETIIKGKSEYGGGWLCWKNKGGCGEKWADGAAAIESQSIEKVENENPADTFNTVLKMAKKRAFVDATITATAASDIFTQDIGDDEGEPPSEAPKTPQSASGGPPKSEKRPTEAPRKQEIASQPRFATDATRNWMLDELKDMPDLAKEYFEKCGQLLPTETLYDLPLRFVPISKEQMRFLRGAICDFGNGSEAVAAFPANPEAQIAEKPPQDPGPSAGEDDGDLGPQNGDLWRGFIIPIPRKGIKRDVYLKNPDTIGSLFDMRHGNDEESAAARQRLFGFVHHFEPKPWKGNDGKERPPSDTDVKFRAALDSFAAWFEKNHPDEQL